MSILTSLKRIIGIHPLAVDHDQEAAQREELGQRRADADKRLKLVQAEARIVRRQ